VRQQQQHFTNHMETRIMMVHAADNIDIDDGRAKSSLDVLDESFLVPVPRGLEVVVMRSLRQKFENGSSSCVTTTNTNMFVWNEKEYTRQVEIATSKMKEKESKKRQRREATSSTIVLPPSTTKKQQNNTKTPSSTHPTTTTTTTDILDNWMPSPSSSFPVGSVQITPGHHVSVGYYACPHQHDTSICSVQPKSRGMTFKSIVSTAGVLEGTAWIQINTKSRREMIDKNHNITTNILQNSKCIGPVLALISTQHDNVCLSSTENKYTNHTLPEMISEIRRHFARRSLNIRRDDDDSENEDDEKFHFRTRWDTAFSVWKQWVLGVDGDGSTSTSTNNSGNVRDQNRTLWRKRLSDEDYKALQYRIKTNRLRFRLSCVRQDPPAEAVIDTTNGGTSKPVAGKVVVASSSAPHNEIGAPVSQKDDNAPDVYQPLRRHGSRGRHTKSSRRKGNALQYTYERRDLLEGLMNDSICSQKLVPYYHMSNNRCKALECNNGPSSNTSERCRRRDSSGDVCDGGWTVDLKNFDVELVVIIIPGSPGRLAFGISLLPYPYCHAKSFDHGGIPSDISSPFYVAGSSCGGGVAVGEEMSSQPSGTQQIPSVFNPSVIRLRPTTAHILLDIANLKPGDIVLDPFVGIGTIAMEADLYSSTVIGIGGDLVLNDPTFTRMARGVGADGILSAWDASCMPIRAESVDAIVSDLPFGQNCLSVNTLHQLMPLVFLECARVLRPGGRMVLLCGNTPVTMLGFVQALSGQYWERPFSRFSPVTIGGLVAWVVEVCRNRTVFDPNEEERRKYRNRVRKMTGRREQNNRQRHSEFTQQNARQKKKRLIAPSSPSIPVPTPGPKPNPTPAPTPVGMNVEPKLNSNTNTPNVVIISEAGKPIFTRFPIKVKFGLLVQALRTSINRNNSLRLGEMQCLESNKKIITFMTVGSITLMSICDRSEYDGCGNAFVFARYRLEYVYAQLIMTLTDQVQTMFQSNPSLDLQSTMISNSKLLRGMLDDMDAADSTNKAAPYMVAAVSSLFPFSFKIRHRVSKALQSVAGRPENNAAFALLVAGDKLISIVQPPYPLLHQLKTSDIHLILQFVAKQPGLTSSELWMPICLPRFNSSGFLYAYGKCVDDISKLTIIILSSHGTTEQFQLLRDASIQLQKDLRIPLSADSVITAQSSSSSVKDNTYDSVASASSRTSSDNMEWKKGDESTSFDETVDEDYVNISNDMILGKDTAMQDGELLYHTRQALDEAVVEAVCTSFLGDNRNSLIYFLFRLDVPIKDCSLHSQRRDLSTGSQRRGFLSQCISLPEKDMDDDGKHRRQRLWSNYQKISLRLRLGSSTVESSMDAFDMINISCSPSHEIGDDGTTGEDLSFPSISKDSPAMGLIESPPCTVDAITYILEGDQTYLGMNGKDFELFLVVTSDISVKRAAAIGTKLVRGIMSEEKRVFLSKPLTWRY
jgi:SAM-dependent methyltransferase